MLFSDNATITGKGLIFKQSSCMSGGRLYKKGWRPLT